MYFLHGNKYLQLSVSLQKKKAKYLDIEMITLTICEGTKLSSIMCLLHTR